MDEVWQMGVRCKHCKTLKQKESMITINMSRFCDRQCAIDYALDKEVQKRISAKVKKEAEREAKKKHARRKRAFYENDVKTRKKAAKTACHEYIRTRDFGQPCICCGRELGQKYDAGHFIESGNNPRIRYDEDNIHAQSVYCNQYKGGNSDDYRGRLIQKIGLERVLRLESMKGGIVKRTAQDYKDIQAHYENKLKALLAERGESK